MDEVMNQLNPLIAQVIAALVGLLLTALLGFLAWATAELRQWLKAKKLTTLRRIFDGMVENAKKAITPELLAQGEQAVGKYLERYAKQTVPGVLSKMGVDDNALTQRMLTEAAGMVRVYMAVSGKYGSATAGNMATLGWTGQPGDLAPLKGEVS